MAKDKDLMIDIHESLKAFIDNIYPPFKALGFTPYQAYVCAMLNDINTGICDLKQVLEELCPPDVEGEVKE